MSNQVYQIITDKIIELLEKDIVPWNKPFVDGIEPTSLNTKKSYRGINNFMLNATAIDRGYKSNYWVTYKHAQELGGNVRKGEKGTPVVYWNRIRVEDKDTGEEDIIPLLRYYTVFNVEQCDNLDYPSPQPITEFEAIELAENLIGSMPNKPEIRYDIGGAYYSPGLDYVNLPHKEMFDSREGYYSTMFHELVHSTGHPTRLSRFAPDNNMRFGSEDYSKEELVAEVGAAMLCGVSGIENTIENSTAYVKSWLQVLKDDPRMVVIASAQAQKAADYIRGISYNNKETE